jgi:cell wall-associated NlpC family hydrolase
MQKKLVGLVLAAVLTAGQFSCIFADEESDLREEAAWTEYQLGEMYNRIDQLYYQKQELDYQISVLNDNLFGVMVNIQVLENDIAVKEDSIKKTQGDLTKAENARDNQEESMKKRIQYIYEKGGDDAWFAMIMNADNIADLLTRAEYTQQMYEQDRKSLELYANTVAEVSKLENKYKQEKADLQTMQQEYEEVSNELEYQLAIAQDTSADYENEIEYAQYMATEYANLLAEQTAEIERLEAERIAYEEYLAEQAALEAEMAAMEEADGYDEDTVRRVAEDLTVYDEDGNAISAVDAAQSGGTYFDSDGDVVDASAVVKSVASTAGSSVVDFATQFVGNPYVWGGTSLTNGADCSGFVQSVFANFGVSLPRTSYEQQNAGTEVSYADAQPGDLICYGGHVAIYMGDGKIVHAANSDQGIIVSDNAAYQTITSVRRLV